jgi:hypothetical protein
MCVPEDGGPAGEHLLRGPSDVNPITWPGGGTEYHLGHGEWIRMLRTAGFVVDALHELTPPESGHDHEYYDIVTRHWSQRWPAEDVWVAHRPARASPFRVESSNEASREQEATSTHQNISQRARFPDAWLDERDGVHMTDKNIHGPIDFVLIEFPSEANTASMATALSDLVDGGTIRLFDIALVHKTSHDDSGRRELESADALAPFAGAQSGLFDDEDIQQAVGAMEPGTLALLVAYENSWAAPFVGAALGIGGQLIASERIPAPVVIEALDAADSQS